MIRLARTYFGLRSSGNVCAEDARTLIRSLHETAIQGGQVKQCAV